MSIIKCPECGKEISTSATTCPHCGYPLTTPTTVVINNTIANADWVKKWKNKALSIKIITGIIAALFLAFLATSIVFYILNSGNSFNDSFVSNVSSKFLYFSLIGVSAMGTLITVALFITSLIRVRVKVKEYDGSIICVYTGGINNYLLIDNVEQYSCGPYRYVGYLYGSLPNSKRKVTVTIKISDMTIAISDPSDTDVII
ncbi:MAG: zinc ribbon domain-containing protein [Bacilli bacterium]